MNSARMLVSLIATVLICTGCNTGPTLYPVTGTVTYNGTPVEGASVTFVPDKGPMVIGTTTDANGKFTVLTDGKPGAPKGTYKATVNKQAKTEGMPDNPTPADMSKMMPKAGGAVPSKAELPVKYSVVQSTDLSVTVTDDAAKNAAITLDLK